MIGMTQLTKGLRVYVKSSDLLIMKRFRYRPRHLARNLHLSLVKREDLNNIFQQSELFNLLLFWGPSAPM